MKQYLTTISDSPTPSVSSVNGQDEPGMERLKAPSQFEDLPRETFIESAFAIRPFLVEYLFGKLGREYSC